MPDFASTRCFFLWHLRLCKVRFVHGVRTNGNSEDLAAEKRKIDAEKEQKNSEQTSGVCYWVLYGGQSADEAPSISVLRINHNGVSSRVGTEDWDGSQYHSGRRMFLHPR